MMNSAGLLHFRSAPLAKLIPGWWTTAICHRQPRCPSCVSQQALSHWNLWDLRLIAKKKKASPKRLHTHSYVGWGYMARNKHIHSFFFDAFRNGRPQVSSAGDKEQRRREHYYTLDGTLISLAKNGRSYSCQQAASWPNKFFLMPCQDVAMLGCGGSLLVEDREASGVLKERGRRSERQIWSEGNKCSAPLFASFPRRYGDEQDNFEQTQIGSAAGQVTYRAVFPSSLSLFLILPHLLYSCSFPMLQACTRGSSYSVPHTIIQSSPIWRKKAKQNSVYSDSVREVATKSY